MRALSSHERYAHTTGHKVGPDTRNFGFHKQQRQPVMVGVAIGMFLVAWAESAEAAKRAKVVFTDSRNQANQQRAAVSEFCV